MRPIDSVVNLKGYISIETKQGHKIFEGEMQDGQRNGFGV